MNTAQLIRWLTVGGLFAMMFSTGLRVSWKEVLASSRSPRAILSGVTANFVLVPAVTLGLLRLFDAESLVSAGFLILAVCPGAPVGPLCATLGRGDVPYAVAQMVILAGLSVFLAPALLGALLGRFLPASELHVDYPAIVRTLLMAQLLPLGAGLVLHHRAQAGSRRIARPLALIANLALLTAVALILVRDHETLGLIRTRGWLGMLLLLTAALAIGWLCGGPAPVTRKTLALTTAARNAAVALVIVSGDFANTPAVTAVVAFGLVSIFGSLGSACLFGFMSQRWRPHLIGTP